MSRMATPPVEIGRPADDAAQVAEVRLDAGDVRLIERLL